MAKRSMTDAKRRKANAQAQARWQAKHLERTDGKKENCARARRRRQGAAWAYYGYRPITDRLERWSAETDSGVSEEIAKSKNTEAPSYTCND